jgi:type II restriction enzyme
MEKTALVELIERYKSDPESVYNTWFVGGEERMKAFRAIRRGVRDTVDSIAAGTFGNDFKGSPLEVVLTAITEQKQVFEGAAHPFFWKPTHILHLRERVQETKVWRVSEASNATPGQVLAEISARRRTNQNSARQSPTSCISCTRRCAAFNTAMVNGFNACLRQRARLVEFSGVREDRARRRGADRLSKDLGAFAGLLGNVGPGSGTAT